MDDKFLSYSNAGSKPESSNFDGTIQNLFTANFGGLTPVFCKPVLADDHFKISLNSEVKVSTLNAPAYSNIKQNFYSFFVANQQIWKHYNSFITNGTDFQGVYGSNLNNQNISNSWKIPSIRVNDLQFITKVAKGFAIPVFTLNASSGLCQFFENVGFEIVTSDDNSMFFIKLFDYDNIFSFDVESTNSFDLTSIACNLLSITHPLWRTLVKLVPYMYMHNCHITKENGSLYLGFTSIDLGLSLDDMTSLINLLSSSSPVFSISGSVDTLDFQSLPYHQFVRYRLFCDESSHDLNINESPFGVRYVRSDIFNGQIALNGLRYYRKYTQNFESDSIGTLVLPDADSISTYYNVNTKYVRLSQFWQKRLNVATSVDSDKQFISIDTLSNQALLIGSSSPLFEKYLELFESDDFYPESFYENKTIYCGCDGFELVDNFSGSRPLDQNLVDDYNDKICVTSLDSNDYRSSLRNCACDTLFSFFVGSFDQFTINDLVISNYEAFSNGVLSWFSLSAIPRVDSSSMANNMTQSSFMYYLCNSVLKSLDYVGIPYEGFTIRDFDSYSLEVISALPFMALSSIWNEYFRNRTVSSPELDFKEVNYSALLSPSVLRYMKFKESQGYKSEYFDLTDDNSIIHSWVIPFDVLPKNGLQLVELDNIFIQGLNEFHYYNVTCFCDLFSLLTGFQLNHSVINHVIHSVHYDDDSSMNVLYGALMNRFILPDYYNGLLHYKFQNFSKDYFSSALLDAMSGANQEEIPDTVTELRSSEARQSFWEQTAVARSVKKFFNKMFGTTPTHMELCRPLLLGQSHNKISIGEIIQTSGTLEDSTPQGTRTGIGGGHSVNGICNHGFNEQGWLIILSSFTLDSQYFQGLNRLLIPYNSYLDYPFRNFYHIGNQSINMREISFVSNPKYPSYFVNPSNIYGLFSFDSPSNPNSFTTVANNPQIVTTDYYDVSVSPNCCIDSDANFGDVFGFIPRFSEYKFNFDELHGDFRNTLMSWNTFRKFHTIPFLSHNFVNWEFSGVNYDLNRLFAVTDDSDKFICSLYINVQMHRQIPYYSIPKSSVN